MSEQRELFDNDVRAKYEDLVQDNTVRESIKTLLASPDWAEDFEALIEIAIENLTHTPEELKVAVAEVRKWQQAEVTAMGGGANQY